MKMALCFCSRLWNKPWEWICLLLLAAPALHDRQSARLVWSITVFMLTQKKVFFCKFCTNENFPLYITCMQSALVYIWHHVHAIEHLINSVILPSNLWMPHLLIGGWPRHGFQLNLDSSALDKPGGIGWSQTDVTMLLHSTNLDEASATQIWQASKFAHRPARSKLYFPCRQTTRVTPRWGMGWGRCTGGITSNSYV